MKSQFSKNLISIFFILVIANIFNFNLTSNKFKFITILYNETNEQRIQEYKTCLEKNLTHQCIDKIHIIYDTTKDNQQNRLLDYIKTKNLTISYINNRPSFGYCFDMANKNYPNSKIILSNADIYFNETLNLLENYDLTNKFIALTRWDIQKDGTMKLFNNGRWNGYSQDIWIFSTPIKKIEKDYYQLGTLNAESIMLYYVSLNGLQILNPCLSIQCCHLHLSGIRNYVHRVIYHDEIRSGKFKGIPFSNLY